MEHARPARRQHVSIAGNIGVGKSTLVGILAEELGWQPYYELVADHPYLDDYYANQERWGFHSQIWFLSQRYEQHLEIADTPISVCQDRSIYEDYEVFVDCVMQYNESYNDQILCFANSIPNPDGGTHLTGFRLPCPSKSAQTNSSCSAPIS